MPRLTHALTLPVSDVFGLNHYALSLGGGGRSQKPRARRQPAAARHDAPPRRGGRGCHPLRAGARLQRRRPRCPPAGCRRASPGLRRRAGGACLWHLRDGPGGRRGPTALPERGAALPGAPLPFRDAPARQVHRGLHGPRPRRRAALGPPGHRRRPPLPCRGAPARGGAPGDAPGTPPSPVAVPRLR